MKSLHKKILNVVYEEQKKQGITTRNLAQMAGCTERALSYWKCGKRNISLRMAEKVLGTLGYELTIIKKEE